MINHHIVRFHIAMHNAHGVAKVERLQNLENVEASVEVGQRLVQLLEIGVVYVLEDQRFGEGWFWKLSRKKYLRKKKITKI